MSTSPTDLASATALVVGMGGLGCPAALALARAGVGTLVLADDDLVQESNLHRQLLYGDGDVGRDKLDAAKRALDRIGTDSRIELVRSRCLPDNARALVSAATVVVEGADNFATKFLVADACHLEGAPVVHGAAIRWTATAWSVAPTGRPCFRCLFEDVPAGSQANCDEAGVMGPVVGFAGALLAELALRVLTNRPTYGVIFTYDGKSDSLREVTVSARAACPLCGGNPTIFDTEESRYTAPSCAA